MPAPGAYGAPGGAYGGGGGYGGAGPYAPTAGPIPGGYGAGGYGVSASSRASTPAATQQLSVPNDIAGAIIGRGGAKINEIRQMSQAQVSPGPALVPCHLDSLRMSHRGLNINII